MAATGTTAETKPEKLTVGGSADLFGWVTSVAEKGAAFALMIAGLVMTVIPTVGLFADPWGVSVSLGIYVASLAAGVGAMVAGGIVALITEQSIRKESLAAYQTTVDRTNRSADLYEKLLAQIARAEGETQTQLTRMLPDVLDAIKQSYVLPPTPKKDGN
jgi:hypothetical protein